MLFLNKQFDDQLSIIQFNKKFFWVITIWKRNENKNKVSVLMTLEFRPMTGIVAPMIGSLRKTKKGNEILST